MVIFLFIYLKELQRIEKKWYPKLIEYKFFNFVDFFHNYKQNVLFSMKNIIKIKLSLNTQI